MLRRTLLAFLILAAAPWAAAQVPRLVAQQGHVYPVDIALMAPDGRTLATVGQDRWVVWEAASGRELMRLTPDERGLELIGFATDGRFVITRVPGTEATVDARTGEVVEEAVAPGPITLWDVSTGAVAQPSEPDGIGFAEALGETYLAAALDVGPVVRVLRPGEDALEISYVGTTRPRVRVALGRSMRGVEEGQAVFADQRYGFGAILPEGTAQVWDSRTGETVFAGASSLVSLFAVDRAPDDRWVALFGLDVSPEGDSLYATHIHDTHTGERTDTVPLDGMNGNDTRLAAEFGPTSRFVRIPGYHIWDRQAKTLLDPPPGTVIGTAFLQARPVFLMGEWTGVFGQVRAVDAETGAELQRYAGQTMGAARGGFHGAERLALGSWEERAVVWDLVVGRERQRSDRLGAWVIDAAAAGDTLVAVATDGTFSVTVGDSTTARYAFAGRAPNDLLTRLSAVENGRVVLEKADTLRVIDLNAERLVAEFDHEAVWRRQAALVGAGFRVVAGGDVVEARPDTVAAIMDDPDVTALALSRSGEYMLGARSAGDGIDAFVRDLANGTDGAVLVGLVDTLQAQSASETMVSSTGDHVLITSPRHGWLWDTQTGDLRHRWTWPIVSVNTLSAFSPDGRHVAIMSVDDIGARIYDLETGAEEAVLVSFVDDTWAVLTPDGRFDASNGGAVDGLHWVVGLETIDLDQLKARYYEPGLLAKLLGFNDEPLRDVQGIGQERLGLHPSVEVLDAGGGRFRVRLVNRGGGIGPVQVLLNGREVIADARPTGADPWAEAIDLDLDLADHPYLSGDAENRVVVVPRNAEGFLAGRGLEVGDIEVDEGDGSPPALWAVVVGAGDYAGDALDLRFAAKDAADFGTALRVASEGLFGADATHVRVLAAGEGAGTPDGLPTRDAVLAALAEVAAQAQPDDLVVLYLAGHGTVTGGESGDFHYLTRDALSADLSDPSVRQRVALSSADLTEALLAIPALKQLLILDTCHSGAAVARLSEERTVPGSQIRALDRMKDRSGLYVIAGSAADAVAYETSRFGQGLLTYSLLLGMRGGALREGEFVDVGTLLDFAVDRVPELARGIGGVQQPLVATPRGAQSFDVGRVGPDDQARIPLAQPRPLLVRARFQDEDAFFDGLRLGRRVNEALREVQARDASAPLVFVDADAVEGAHTLVGRYRRMGDAVAVTARIFQSGTTVGEVQVEGVASDLDALVRRLLDRVAAHLQPTGGR